VYRGFLRTSLALALLTAPLRAQQPPADTGLPPVAPPPAEPLPPPEPSPAPSPSTEPPPAPPANECLPACRSGYVCLQSQCVSACNPPCGTGEVCEGSTDGRARCVSACTPACPVGQHCVGPGQCVWNQAPPPARTLDAPVPAEEPAAPSEPEVQGKRLHDGFYLRLGLGVGAFLGNAELTEGEPYGPWPDAHESFDTVEVTGFAIPVEFALGGTPTPGLVIGVGSYAVHIPSAKYKAGRGDYAVEERAEYGSISMIGPFVDYYLDPGAGMHVEVSPALVWVGPGDSDTIWWDAPDGYGWGIMGGFGYEAWVSDQWSVGALARAQFVSAKVEAQHTHSDFYGFVPSVLFTMTWH